MALNYSRQKEAAKETEKVVEQKKEIQKEIQKKEIDSSEGNYVNNELGFKISYPGINLQPKTYDYGDKQELKWDNFQIVAGTFYDDDGKKLDFDDLVKTYISDYKEIDIEYITVDDYLGAKADIRGENLPHPNYQPYSLLAVNKAGTIYFIRANSAAEMEKVIQAFHFLDKEEARLFFPVEKEQLNILKDTGTITGKITQMDTLLLDNTFLLEPIPYNSEELRFYLTFKPGRIINADFFLDDKKLTNVYGFPQFPKFQCDTTHRGEMGISMDEGLYAGTKHTQPFISKDECVKEKSAQFPPVIFFLKPPERLQSGGHILEIKTKGGFEKRLIFTLTDLANPEEEKLTKITEESDNYYNFVSAGDNCFSGYYYEKNYLHLPLINQDIKRVLYFPSFPQSEKEQEFKADRRVYISFGGQHFDLLFPQKSIFYFDSEFKESSEYVGSERELFIPADLLVYKDGSKATVWVESYNNGYYLFEHVELIPIDILGRIYEEFSIPWKTTTFSGCDG